MMTKCISSHPAHLLTFRRWQVVELQHAACCAVHLRRALTNICVCVSLQVTAKVAEASNIVLSNVVQSPKSLARHNTINVSA